MAAEIPRADLVIFQVYLICSLFLISKETANMLRKERERDLMNVTLWWFSKFIWLNLILVARMEVKNKKIKKNLIFIFNTKKKKKKNENQIFIFNWKRDLILKKITGKEFWKRIAMSYLEDLLFLWFSLFAIHGDLILSWFWRQWVMLYKFYK